jgi:pilus assembly protein TadC
VIPLLLVALALLVAPPRRSGFTRLSRLGLIAAPARAVNGRPPGWWLPPTSGIACGLLTATVVGGWVGVALAVVIAPAATSAARRLIRRAGTAPVDPLPLAAGWDLLAACLRAGLPVPLAVRAVAGHLPVGVDDELRTVADRLALGAGAHAAWDVPETSPLHSVARAARRSAHSGAGLAEVAARAAADVRAEVRDAAAARGQRAAVLITGPLGLCFLPAFLVLGVVPVVIGLAGGLALVW